MSMRRRYVCARRTCVDGFDGIARDSTSEQSADKNKNRNGIYIGGLWKNVSLKNEDTNSMADLARE